MGRFPVGRTPASRFGWMAITGEKYLIKPPINADERG